MCADKGSNTPNNPIIRNNPVPRSLQLLNPLYGRNTRRSTGPRRRPSGSSNLARIVSFPDDPVTMSQSPPQSGVASDTSDDDRLQRDRNETRSPSIPRSDTSSPLTMAGPRSRSVKHLTCFWWKEKGTCRYSDDECLYAHHDTGRYTEAPRQVNPDEPAKAGRNLARALSNLSLTNGHQSSTSIGSAGSASGSRPGSPLVMYGPGPATASDLSQVMAPASYVVAPGVVALQNQLAFYQNLVVSNQDEKNILIDMIHDLQAKIQDSNNEVARLQSQLGALSRENETLRAANMSQSRTNPFGPVGSVSAGYTTQNFGAAGQVFNPTQSAFVPVGYRHSLVSPLSPAPATPSWRSVSSNSAPAIGARNASPDNTNPSDDEHDEGN